MVGKTGFEPATPWAQTRCSTKLSHFPNFYGAPKRSRTPNLLIRSQTLYPIELWALIQFVSSTCISLSLLSNLVKHFSNFFYGAPKRSRTPNLLIRSQTLYPIELWALFSWCLGPESNRHGCHHPQDFKSCASTSSATQAFHLFQGTRLFLKNGVLQRTRTSDPLIKSQMLYQLSYRHVYTVVLTALLL